MVNELVSKEIKINQVEGGNKFRILEGKIEVFKSKEDKNKEFLHEIFQKMDEFNSTEKAELRTAIREFKTKTKNFEDRRLPDRTHGGF